MMTMSGSIDLYGSVPKCCSGLSVVMLLKRDGESYVNPSTIGIGGGPIVLTLLSSNLVTRIMVDGFRMFVILLTSMVSAT